MFPRKTIASISALACLIPACLAQSNKPLCSTLRPVSFCGNPAKPVNSFCPDLPHDVNFNQLLAGYSTLNAVCQQPFDDFGWQMFIALNWPVNDNSAPRPWERYTDVANVFDKAELATMMKMTAAAGATSSTKILYRIAKESPLLGEHPTPFLEADGKPLIDRNLNFTLYEVRINPIWVNYVVNTAKLSTLAEQQAFIKAKHTVDFPAGHYADDVNGTGGSVGAMEIKAAWRILDPSKGDKPERFYTRRAMIYIPGSNTVSGKPLVIRNVLVGLVALHINVKTKDGKGSVWPTFEQEDNAPSQGAASSSTMYSYYNPACTTCTPNSPPAMIGHETAYLWGDKPPYAQRYAVNGKYGTQVEIVNPIYDETQQTNARWHAKLGNSVWKHYRLVGTQWVDHESRQPTGIPPILGNAAQETYLQAKSTCIGCHTQATLAATPSTAADFSFLLYLAH